MITWFPPAELVYTSVTVPGAGDLTSVPEGTPKSTPLWFVDAPGSGAALGPNGEVTRPETGKENEGTRRSNTELAMRINTSTMTRIMTMFCMDLFIFNFCKNCVPVLINKNNRSQYNRDYYQFLDAIGS